MSYRGHVSLLFALAATMVSACTVTKDGPESESESATAAGKGSGSGGKVASKGGSGGKVSSSGTAGKGSGSSKAASGGSGGAPASDDSSDSSSPDEAGGTGGKGNAEAKGGAGSDTPTARIAIETFEDNAPFGDWSADNAESHDGSMSLHPPPIDPMTTAVYEYACDGKDVNQVRYWLNIASGLDGQKLDFKVDGKLYESFDETFYSSWRPRILTLARGQHQFTWIASTTNSGEPAFWIDTIECFDNPESANTSGAFGFQENFVPREIAGTWVIDNWGPDTSHPTNLAAHPPVVAPSDAPAFMEFSCGDKPHGKLTFNYATHNLSTGWHLKFYVDGQLKETFAETYGSWKPRSILHADPSKAPKYKWVAEADVNGRPEVWVDEIKCE